MKLFVPERSLLSTQTSWYPLEIGISKSNANEANVLGQQVVHSNSFAKQRNKTDWFSLTKRKSQLKHQKTTKEFEDIERKIKHIKQKLNSGQFEIRVGGQKIPLRRKPGDESDKNILVKVLMTKTPVPLRSPQFAQFKDPNGDFYSKETNLTLMKSSNPYSTTRAMRTHTNTKYSKVQSPTEEFSERMQSIELSSSANQINLLTEVKVQVQNQQMCGWLNSNNQIGEMYEYQIDDYMVQN